MTAAEVRASSEVSGLNLVAYISPLVAYETPTGVGQHIRGMFSALQCRQDVSFGLVTPRGTLNDARELTSASGSSHLLPVPWSDRPLRYATTFASLVSLDRWLGDADWVYVPAEQPVTTTRRLAVTVHDVYAFETATGRVPGRPSASLSWRLRMKRILDRADLIVTVSEFTRGRMLELFEPRAPERITVIGNGGAEGFNPERRPDDDQVLGRHMLTGSDYVLFPGSLTRRKGADLLLEVARLSQQRKTGLRFAVIGKRHDGGLLTQLGAIKAGRPSFPVTLLGYVTKGDLAALYRHACATLFPSRYEGFGIPVVEALASGCPLFISEQPALLEVAAGRATVIDDDPSAVLEALLRARPNGQGASVATHTWPDCAARLVAAMQ